MINKKDFEEIRQELEEFDSEREYVILCSRQLVKLSKTLIYSTHRNNLENSKKVLKDITSKKKELEKAAKKSPALYYSGPFRIAMQEFVEAVCYFEFSKSKSIPSAKDLGVDYESYLAGLCDLTGELVRKAINSAIKGDFKEALFIKSFVSELYDELMLFDFKNDLRRKFDSIKYDLKKLDEIALGIALKEK